MSGRDQPEVVRWYTLARKFPTLIGRTTDGKKLPGGPYTPTQVITAGGMLFVGYRTMHLWAHSGLVGNYAILLGGTYAVVWLLGRLPLGTRNPVKIATGFGRAFAAPRTGRLGGRPVRIRRPHRVRHSVSVLASHPPAARASTEPQPAEPSPRPAPQIASPRTPALSSVQLLLAQLPPTAHTSQEQ